MTYPILLDLRGRRVVVIGGGKVAARKVIDLVQAGAEVVVISPTLNPDIEALGERVEIHQVAYRDGMLTDMIQWELDPLLVFVATDSGAVNERAADEAYRLHLLVDVADAPDTGSFRSMAALRRGRITIAISTGGASPVLAAHLRARLEAEIGEEYVSLARWLGELRPKVRRIGTPESRRELWRTILDSTVLDRLRAGDEAGARAIIDALVEDFVKRNAG